MRAGNSFTHAAPREAPATHTHASCYPDIVPPLLILIGFLAGLALGMVITATVLQRRRAATVRALQEHVLPVLERRAIALNIPTQSTPQVNFSGDGDLHLDESDPMSRVLGLGEAIDDHEHSQVGFLDTIRISKEEVDQQVSASRKKSG